jgi:hypothetical protein
MLSVSASMTRRAKRAICEFIALPLTISTAERAMKSALGLFIRRSAATTRGVLIDPTTR